MALVTPFSEVGCLFQLWVAGEARVRNTARPPPFSVPVRPPCAVLRSVGLFGRVGATKQTLLTITWVMAYRCETTTVEGFIQLLACNYLPHGYWYYVTGWVPAEKDPQQVDEKLIAKYAIDRSRSARSRRKQLGQANLQYLRHGRLFVLIATKGEHAFFTEEAAGIRDVRRVPLRFAGYSISYRRGGRTVAGQADVSWHSHVQIERSRYRELKALLLDRGVRQSAEALALEFYRLPFEPYAPVRRQMFALLRAVNRVRRQAGLAPLPPQILPLRRRVVRPFDSVKSRSSKARDGDWK